MRFSLPNNPFRRKHNDRVTSQAHEREIERAEATLLLLQEQANKTDEARHHEEAHKKIERKSWAKEIALAKRQYEAAKRLNCITGVTAFFAFISAIGIIWSIHDARDATVIANRAWLMVEAKDHTIDFVAPNVIISLNFQNVGKEPAIDINFSRRPLIYFDDFNPRDAIHPGIRGTDIDMCKGLESISHGMIAYPAPAESAKEVYSFEIKSEMKDGVTGLLNGTKGLMIVGCVAYTTFKHLHLTQYCLFEHKWPDNTIKPENCEKGAYAN